MEVIVFLRIGYPKSGFKTGDSVSLFALLNSESVPCYCIYYAFGHKSGHGRRNYTFKKKNYY